MPNGRSWRRRYPNGLFPYSMIFDRWNKQEWISRNHKTWFIYILNIYCCCFKFNYKNWRNFLYLLN
jgi:hypothetical protein